VWTDCGCGGASSHDESARDAALHEFASDWLDEPI
jgi:hypothetical protein